MKFLNDSIKKKFKGSDSELVTEQCVKFALMSIFLEKVTCAFP